MVKLLLVDQSERDRDRVAAALTSYDVFQCASGKEAIDIVRNDDTIGVVILSWEISGEVGGPEVLSRIRRFRPELPVVVTTALLDLSRAARASALGANEVLLKPLDRANLTAAVDSALHPEADSDLLRDLMRKSVGTSDALLATLRELARVILVNQTTILLVGENGTGKELLARAVHELGKDSSEPFIAVNMPGLPSELVESILFGHERGAFTGAEEQHLGAFERCGSGTLFLDEISEFNIGLQAKLLRAVEQRVFQRVGGRGEIPFKARLVCATNRNLVEAIAKGEFREDLYHRIATYEIRTPPLRERHGDICSLAHHFLDKYSDGRNLRITREAMHVLENYPFYGNIRELENLIQSAITKCRGEGIGLTDLPLEIMQERVAVVEVNSDSDEFTWPTRLFDLTYKNAFREIENAFAREYFPEILRRTNGRIGSAAKLADIDPKTFRLKCESAGLPR